MQVVRFGRQKDRKCNMPLSVDRPHDKLDNASDSDLTTEPSLGRIALVALVCSIDIALQQSKEVKINQNHDFYTPPALSLLDST